MGAVRTSMTSTRTRRVRIRRALGALLAAGMAVPLAATAAHAEVTLTVPHGVEAFPGLDIVGVTGYDEPITVEVWRDGVKLGSSGAPQLPGVVVPDEDEVGDPMSRMLEINHDSSVCWAGHTPDITAGDEIRVITAAGDPAYQKMDVADVSVNDPQVEALDADGRLNDVVMTGRAVNPDGTPMDLAATEAEIVQPAFRDVGVPGWDRRVLIAATTGTDAGNGTTVFGPDDTGTLKVDPANPGYWVATWKNLPVPTADRPSFADLALDGEANFIVSEGTGTEEAGGLGTTIAQPGDASGGVPGCPPAITYGVTGTTPSNVNIATAAAGGDLQIWGKTYNSSAVEVTIDDTDTDPSDEITVPGTLTDPVSTDETDAPVASVRQTWSASVPMAQVLDEDLGEGELVVSGQYTLVEENAEQRTTVDPLTGDEYAGTVYTHTETPIGGTSHTLLKDLRAPLAPSASFPGGDYLGTQWLGLSAQDEIEETVRYRVGGANVAAPTAGSPAVPGQVALSTSQTVKARSYDRAGNPGQLLTETYTIRADARVPGRPGKPTATAGNARAEVAWTAPADNGGAPITGYRVRIYNRVGDTTFEVTVPNRLQTMITGLTNGRTYTFTVAAINRAGEGSESLPSEPVTPTGHGGNPGGDTKRPKVVRCSPKANETDVQRRDNLRCKMDEPVRGVRNGTVRLKETATGNRVAVAVRYNAADRRIVINPNRSLEKATRYTVVLTSGITDRAGNRLARVAWRFTTNT
jgi:hypothetical protein